MKPAVIFLYLSILAFIAVCGAALYEHVAMIPVWTQAPPASLAMFHGEFGAQPARFWQAIHPTVLLITIVALALNWKNIARRNLIGATLGGYLLVLIITGIYFVPELMALTQDLQAQIPAEEWQSRAKTWELLSIVRMVFMLGLAIPLIHSVSVRMPVGS